jgi:hypothetical protein
MGGIVTSKDVPSMLDQLVGRMAIRKAREHVPGRDNLSWGKFVQAAVMKASLA